VHSKTVTVRARGSIIMHIATQRLHQASTTAHHTTLNPQSNASALHYTATPNCLLSQQGQAAGESVYRM
jgi:hypothetical protein